MPAWAGCAVICKDCVDSTNEEAKRGGDSGAKHGTVYCAKRQTAGKGRRGRSWLSDTAGNLYFTILLRPKLKTNDVSMLTLVMAHAVAEAIIEQTKLQTFIKWPNDIVINNKKVCGILSEMKLEGATCAYCVIGVGINVEERVFPTELRKMATSINTELPEERKILPEMLLDNILRNFEDAYEAVCKADSLTPILDRYNELMINRGKAVRVLEPGNEYEALATGISPSGELLVVKDGKELRRVYAGEVSVRGLYGYV